MFRSSPPLQVVIITAGVVVFNLGKASSKKGGHDSSYGLGLICFRLGLGCGCGCGCGCGFGFGFGFGFGLGTRC